MVQSILNRAICCLLFFLVRADEDISVDLFTPWADKPTCSFSFGRSRSKPLGQESVYSSGFPVVVLSQGHHEQPSGDPHCSPYLRIIRTLSLVYGRSILTTTTASYTSRFRTSSAFSSINFRRLSTSSPISVEKMFSVSARSCRSTFNSVRVSAFMVVDHS